MTCFSTIHTIKSSDTMTYEELLKRCRQDQYPPVIVLNGEESYYIDRMTDYVEEHALDEANRAFDQVVLYGRDLPGADISHAVAQARGFSMMGGRKVVIVKEAQAVKKWEALAQYMGNIQPNSILLIAYRGKVDGRLKLWSGIEKNGGALVTSDKLRDYQVAKWINDYVTEQQIAIEPKVAQILADSLGTDLTAIVNALRKLIDGRPQGCNRIDAALVERNIGISKDYNIFELQDALIAGDVLRANRITQYFASSKDHPLVKELGILYGFFANLMIYHYIPNKDERTVAAELKINPFLVKNYVAAARRFNAMKTMRIIGYIRDIDARSKGINNPSAKDDDLWKELIYKILH